MYREKPTKPLNLDQLFGKNKNKVSTPVEEKTAKVEEKEVNQEKKDKVEKVENKKVDKVEKVEKVETSETQYKPNKNYDKNKKPQFKNSYIYVIKNECNFSKYYTCVKKNNISSFMSKLSN